MVKLYCDRCGKEVEKLFVEKVPDPEKLISSDGYSTKEIGLCRSCSNFVKQSVSEFNQAMTKTRFAFYDVLLKRSDNNV